MGHFEYMRAWVRLNALVDVELWSDDLILQSFTILPQPKIKYPQWIALVSGEEEEPETPAPRQKVYADPAEFHTAASRLIDAGIVEAPEAVEEEVDDASGE